MSNPTNNFAIYDYYNLSSYIKQRNIKNPINFRYLHDIVNTKIAMFGYENLPGDLTDEIMETAICFNNKLCFYKSSVYGVILCRYLPLGDYDIYWKPKKVQILALNGLTIADNVDYKDIVLVRDNTMDIIPFIYINEYIEKLVECESTLMKNVKLLQLPAVFTGNKQLLTTFNQLIKKTLEIDPFTVADKQVVENFKQFDIKLGATLEEQLSLYKNWKNMCLESVGIYGVETQKRERLLVREIQSQTEYIDFMYQQLKNERERAIKEANAKWGSNMKLVEIYKQYRTEEINLTVEEEKKIADATDKEGGNGNV